MPLSFLPPPRVGGVRPVHCAVLRQSAAMVAALPEKMLLLPEQLIQLRCTLCRVIFYTSRSAVGLYMLQDHANGQGPQLAASRLIRAACL